MKLKLEKVKVSPQPNLLKANYTVTMEPGEIEVGDDLAKEVQKELDEAMMLSILKTLRYTDIKFHLTPEILEWCKENIKTEWKYLAGHYAFENKKDAEWFILRWL